MVSLTWLAELREAAREQSSMLDSKKAQRMAWYSMWAGRKVRHLAEGTVLDAKKARRMVWYSMWAGRKVRHLAKGTVLVGMKAKLRDLCYLLVQRKEAEKAGNSRLARWKGLERVQK